jgi:uncharacterized protein YdhG (YjbR/CyaY superfamily)
MAKQTVKPDTSAPADLEKIEAYLQAQPEEPRATLQALRATIRDLAPQAVEGLSYGMPAFRYRGRPLAGYSASKNHCSYFPMSADVMAALEGEFAGYETSKGGFKFPIGQPPPATLIEKLLQARMQEIDAK